MQDVTRRPEVVVDRVDLVGGVTRAVRSTSSAYVLATAYVTKSQIIRKSQMTCSLPSTRCISAAYWLRSRTRPHRDSVCPQDLPATAEGPDAGRHRRRGVASAAPLSLGGGKLCLRGKRLFTESASVGSPPRGPGGPWINGGTAPWPPRPRPIGCGYPHVGLVMHVLNRSRHATARPKSSRHVDELLDERATS
jgi:hypothetical protein